MFRVLRPRRVVFSKPLARWAPGWLLVGAVGWSGCSGDADRTAVGTVRDPATCAESERTFVMKSPYGGAGSLEEPREWCGLIDGDMVCFLSKDNGGPFSGSHLARQLSEGEVPPTHPALHCWQGEITAWDSEWSGEEYHPLWSAES